MAGLTVAIRLQEGMAVRVNGVVRRKVERRLSELRRTAKVGRHIVGSVVSAIDHKTLHGLAFKRSGMAHRKNQEPNLTHYGVFH